MASVATVGPVIDEPVRDELASLLFRLSIAAIPTQARQMMTSKPLRMPPAERTQMLDAASPPTPGPYSPDDLCRHLGQDHL